MILTIGFEFDGEYESKLDFSRAMAAKVAALLTLEVLFLDEVSMLDVDIWEAMTKLLGIADHTRNGFREGGDEYPVTVCELSVLRATIVAQAFW